MEPRLAFCRQDLMEARGSRVLLGKKLKSQRMQVTEQRMKTETKGRQWREGSSSVTEWAVVDKGRREGGGHRREACPHQEDPPHSESERGPWRADWREGVAGVRGAGGETMTSRSLRPRSRWGMERRWGWGR